jgi:hypothetical protein
VGMTGNQPGHVLALPRPAHLPGVPLVFKIEHLFFFVKRRDSLLAHRVPATSSATFLPHSAFAMTRAQRDSGQMWTRFSGEKGPTPWNLAGSSYARERRQCLDWWVA